MKSLLFTLSAAVILAAGTAQAQQAKPLDTQAASAALDQQPVKPKFTSKAPDPVVERTYTKSARVRIRKQSGAVEELPYVEVPILFRVNTDELLDSVSAANVLKTAEVLRPLLVKGAEFCIEGHASAEGDAQHNRELSALRAAKIRTLLTGDHGLDGNRMNEKGFGSTHAQHPANAIEAELQQDRRVLVVRTR